MSLLIMSEFLLLLAILWLAFRLYYTYRFLRNPERNWTNDWSLFLSPAYWTVSEIIKRDAKSVSVKKKYASIFQTQTEEIWEAWRLINIMMTPLDIHFQRACYPSKVITQTYISWKFLNAVHDAWSLTAHFENERNEITFETAKWMRYKVIQIAWFLARRIHSYVHVWTTVSSAQTTWLISLWSQVSVILPLDWIEIKIKKGQKVIDGESVLATISGE